MARQRRFWSVTTIGRIIGAADDLSQDIEGVTGHAAPMIKQTSQAKGDIVIIGTIGKSTLIDELVRRSTSSM